MREHPGVQDDPTQPPPGGFPPPPGASLPQGAFPPPPGMVPATPPPLPAGLGIRALGILVDTLVWIAIAIPVIVTAGQKLEHPTTPSLGFWIEVNGKVTALSGIPFVVVLVAWLVYMTLTEWAMGASLGKLVVGARVARKDGTPAGLGAVATRNALRIIDVLPFFYIVGAILVKATGSRLGDMAGGTSVFRRGSVTKPRQRIGAMVAGLALIAVAIGGYSLANRTERGLYEGNGITFNYPTSWSELQLGEGRFSAGDANFSVGVGLDPTNEVTVSGYTLRMAVTAENLSQVEAEVSGLADSVASSVGGEVTSGPEMATYGGMPSWHFEVGGQLGGQTHLLHGYMLFDGMTQYWVGCESDEANAEAISAGCDQILATLEPVG